jgi:hypothetical protein
MSAVGRNTRVGSVAACVGGKWQVRDIRCCDLVGTIRRRIQTCVVMLVLCYRVETRGVDFACYRQPFRDSHTRIR